MCPVEFITAGERATGVAACTVSEWKLSSQKPIQKHSLHLYSLNFKVLKKKMQNLILIKVGFVLWFVQLIYLQCDKFIENCTAPGQYRNPSTNVCTNCPVGTYNNVKWQDSCTNCSPGFTTKQNGTTTSNDCISKSPYQKYGSVLDLLTKEWTKLIYQSKLCLKVNRIGIFCYSFYRYVSRIKCIFFCVCARFDRYSVPCTLQRAQVKNFLLRWLKVY